MTISPLRPSFPLHRLVLGLFGAAILWAALSAPAQAQTIIRDTEIEAYMAEWFAPVLKAAGMQPDQVHFILVEDTDINAFVAGGSNIFFYTGLLQKTENAGEVIGVMAHELGHVTGGHLIRGREAMEQASYESMLGMILGVGAAIASGDGGAAATIGTGASSMAQRGFLAHTRAFESSADQAAMRYMDGAGINPTGMLSFMRKLEGQELRSAAQQTQYVRSHPLTRDRIQAIESRLSQSPNKDKAYPAQWDAQHKMMLAKLTGFITPQQVAWIYDDRDRSIEALSARAIAAYRQNSVAEALKLADQLIAAQPENPYFQELKGQMLVDFGRVREAQPYYERAVKAMPDAPLLLIALAHIEIETAGNDKTKLERAINHLNRALKKEDRSTRIHRLLATAYGRKGEEARAKLHLAEEALLQRRRDYAKTQAQAAQNGLPVGSAGWIRAGDILSFVDTMKN